MPRLPKIFSRAISSFKPSSPASTPAVAAAAAATRRATPPVTTTTQAAAMSTAAKTVSASTLLENIKHRRSNYVLSKELPISTDRVQEIVKESLLHVPTSFNAQSNRVVVLFGAEHEKLWDIATEVFKAVIPAAEWEGTAQRFAMFKAAAGSVLFFADDEPVQALQAKLPPYASMFPVWASQSDGMLQHIVWTALDAEGLGANLQHYNLVAERIAKEYDIPASWKLSAELVFGGVAGEPRPKEFLPIEARYKVFGA